MRREYIPGRRNSESKDRDQGRSFMRNSKKASLAGS